MAHNVLPMHVCANTIEAIGRTPLIRLRRASEATGCEIYGKAEFMNPGGSVKDRAALFIVKDAEERGLLRPGGVIVEGTAGNTGIGLALVANARGYRTVIVIPETQSQEKKDALRQFGADLREVPAVPYANPNNYVKVSGRLAEAIAKAEPAGAIWANQFDNVANRRAHYETTGPEIWEQTGGKVDGFICAVGTGGTLAGVGMYPEGAQTRTSSSASPIRWAPRSTTGTSTASSSPKAARSPKASGRAASPRTSKARRSTTPFQIPDDEAIPIVFDLLEHEGLLMGTSTGINVAGRDPPRAAARPRPHDRDRCSPTAASATRAGFSIRSSCARRICRCRRGSKGAAQIPVPTPLV